MYLASVINHVPTARAKLLPSVRRTTFECGAPSNNMRSTRVILGTLRSKVSSGFRLGSQTKRPLPVVFFVCNNKNSGLTGRCFHFCTKFYPVFISSNIASKSSSCSISSAKISLIISSDTESLPATISNNF